LPVIQEINKIKPAITDLANRLDSIPEEIQIIVREAILNAADNLDQAASVIQKHYNDKEELDKITKELQAKISSSDVYKPLTDQEKDKVIETIISSNDKNILTEQAFKKWVRSNLEKLSKEDLIKAIYTKDEIRKLGEDKTFGKPRVTETIKYEAGIDLLLESMATLTGYNQAINYGVSTIYDVLQIRRKYLKSYYF